jgi:predicted negative regulator of RcsB-dependent stress response
MNSMKSLAPASQHLAIAGRLLIALVLSVLLGINTAVAQNVDCGKIRKVPARGLDEATYKQINKAYEAVGEEQYSEAYDILRKMKARAGKDKYLNAILDQALAQVEWQMEKYDLALKNFEAAIESDALPNEAHFSLMYQVAQLYFINDRYDEALEQLALWFCHAPEEKITAAAYVLKASIYVKKEDFENTIKAIDIAIGMEEEPKEQWYQLKHASHYELEQYPQAADTLQILIQHWTDKKVYWNQLAQTYYKLKQEKAALAVMALAYRENLLDTQTDLMFLSSLYANADVPYKAAAVLQKGIEDGIVKATLRHWTSIADSWYAAEELDKALAAYKKAGEVSKDGKIDLRRGFLLVDLEQWENAREALDEAVDKGGLNERQLGEAHLLRGMSEFSLGNYDRANDDWTKARRIRETRDSAQQWLNHLQEERRRRSS